MSKRKVYRKGATVKAERKTYRSPRRSAQVDATRRSILDAARHLFAERGYAGTTVEDIAGMSGLSVPAVYKNFGNKRLLLVHLIDRDLYFPDYADARGRRSPVERVKAMAQMVVNVSSRAADIVAIVRGAIGADPEFEKLLRRIRGDRRILADRMARGLTRDGALRHDRTEKQAADIIYALVGSELYDILVKHTGWSDEQFEAWLADTLAENLLRPERVRRPA